MPASAPACRQAIKDANLRWPSRNRASDGILGDARHQKRKSDHNLGNAVDITHDPRSGCDGDIIAAFAIKDPRVTYVIWNRKIYNRSRASEGWRPYRGSNPHTHHCHISIDERSRNDVRPWAWSPQASGAAMPAQGGSAEPSPPPAAPSNAPEAQPIPAPAAGVVYPGVALKRGARGVLVRRVQERLRVLHWEIVVDGDFGAETDLKVRGFQRRHELATDGIVGRYTWRALFR
ncbi:MAG TPA: peptidoglycan-binding domain-containing protein [Polyangiaceae bacterium]|jgi:hypothetical protein|nr:peptidoglycan-binding domain-containing protein [Polyangiaceae bacterium]